MFFAVEFGDGTSRLSFVPVNWSVNGVSANSSLMTSWLTVILLACVSN